MKAWQAILLGLGALFVARDAKADTPAPGPGATGPGSSWGGTGQRPPKSAGTRGDYQAVAAQARKFARLMGWDDPTAQWFERWAMVQSWTESRGNFAAANETSGEKSAAKRAYESTADRMPNVIAGSTPQQWYGEFGSGGWYGLIPAYGHWNAWRDTAQPGEVHPYDVFDPWRSTVMMAAFIRQLSRRSNFQDLPPQHKNAYAFKRGMAAGSLMDDVSGHPRGDISNKNLDRAVAALGIPEGWKRQPIPQAVMRTPPQGYIGIMREGEFDAA